MSQIVGMDCYGWTCAACGQWVHHSSPHRHSDLFQINPAALRPYHVVSAEMGKLLDRSPVEGKP